MKRMLLATVAAATLVAGPAIAQRQEAPPTKSEAPARAPAPMQNAPAEKVAPAGPVAPDRAADTKAPPASTTGQATPPGRTGAENRPDARPAPNADNRSGDTKPAPNAQTQNRPGAATDGKSNPSAAAPTLTTEQKTKVRTTVLTKDAPRVTSVNFSINVGTVVPRNVRIVAVPAPLIEIHPAWRGYMYFVHGDEIVIVEPGTLRIVAVVDV